MKLRLVIFMVCIFSLQVKAQDGPSSLSELDFSYLTPKEYELGAIRVYGADNYDHQAIKLIAGLRQGKRITLPSEQINTAIKLNVFSKNFFRIWVLVSPI